MRIVLPRLFTALLTTATLFFSPIAAHCAADPALDKAQWIWGGEHDDVCQVRTTVTLHGIPESASVLITADNGYEIFVNGVLVGFDIGAEGEIWSSVERYDLKPRLARGKNVIGIRGSDLGGIRGLIAAIRIEVPGHAPVEMVTDASWHVSARGEPGEYSHPEYIETTDWHPARVLGSLGMTPWGKLSYAGSTGMRRPKALQGALALSKPGPDFTWPGEVAFIGDDCSVYVPLRGDAWGVCFRVGDWSRAYTEFDLPCPSKIGRKLYALKTGTTNATPRLLMDAGKGAIGSPSVSFDGRSIYVAMALNGESFFHIYRLPAAGGTPQRLTDGPFHDIDPAELPDGRIVFSSTRIGSFEEYHNPPSRSLYVMNADGSNIRPLTYTLIFDNEPKVMADGRIAFIRTDNFFDRAKVETQLHVIRPDGTDGLTEAGADVGADYGVRLRALGYGSPAPMPDGRLAFISSRGNYIAAPGASEANFHPLPGGLGDLAPLPDGRLLCTVLRPTGARMNSDVIGVIDPRDNKVTSIFESRDGAVHSPVFLGARPRPAVLPDHTQANAGGQPEATGFLYCQNARFTRKSKADWSQVRAIRVLGALALTTRSSHSHIVHAGHETVELGTVPIAPDGSFYIEVPADMPITLQAVDAEGRSELNEMSWIYVRPGEKRSCLGCHQPRHTTPTLESRTSQALRAAPLKVLGQGRPHRFRGNNSGVTGMMDLQFERFRETASMNRHPDSPETQSTDRPELAQLLNQLEAEQPELIISAAQRLGLLRDRTAAPALTRRLEHSIREVRVACALALSTCGTRDSVPVLLEILLDEDRLVAQAAALALENLTAHQNPFAAFDDLAARKTQAQQWSAWFETTTWAAIEQRLIAQIVSPDRVTQRRAIVALGHIGDTAGKKALREFVFQSTRQNPYPKFENDNRTDSFTYPADSPLNPRTLQEAVRALGWLNDTNAIGLFRDILDQNLDPKTANLYLAEAAIEALGNISSLDAAGILVRSFNQLKEYWQYVGWYSDHPALYACHASPVHARLLEALGQRNCGNFLGPIVPHIIRSVPTDPDRALFPENDAYELLSGRLIRSSGRANEVIETCLALLGDQQAKATEDLKQAISTTFAAWAGKPDPDNRAAQVLSLVCRDRSFEPRIRAVYEQYRAKPEDRLDRSLGNPTWIPQRHWVLFYLGRALGNLQDPRSVDTLLASLRPELNEARHGRPDPSEPNIHVLQLEYTPCWRASAAWALGRIGERRAAPTLLKVIDNLDNATDVRHAAAEALGRLADPATVAELRKLSERYPEHSVQRALRNAHATAAGRPITRLME